MAVTITVVQFNNAMHAQQAGDADDVREDIQLRYEACKALVNERAPDAPAAIQNQAVIMLGSRLASPEARGDVVNGMFDPIYLANAWYSSGCSMLTKPWQSRRAAIPDA